MLVELLLLHEIEQAKQADAHRQHTWLHSKEKTACMLGLKPLLLRLLLFWLQCFDFVFSQQAEHQVSDVVPAVSAHVHQEATQQLPKEKQECAGTHAVQPVLSEAQLRTQNNKGQMLKHINFWHEDELKMAHPEVQVPSLFHAIHNVAMFLLLHLTHYVETACSGSLISTLVCNTHAILYTLYHSKNGTLHTDNVTTSCLAATQITLVPLWGAPLRQSLQLIHDSVHWAHSYRLRRRWSRSGAATRILKPVMPSLMSSSS